MEEGITPLLEVSMVANHLSSVWSPIRPLRPLRSVYYHLWTTKDYHTCVARNDCFLYLRGYLYINNTLNSTMHMDKSTEGTNRPLGVLYGFRPRDVRISWLLAILPCFLVCASNGDRQDRRNRNG